jgi:hypothetical protein
MMGHDSWVKEQQGWGIHSDALTLTSNSALLALYWTRSTCLDFELLKIPLPSFALTGRQGTGLMPSLDCGLLHS